MRAGIFQCAGGGLSAEQRLSKLTHTIQGENLDLVVCPELFMSGYAIGDALTDMAEPVHGPFAKKISILAKAQTIAIIYGYPEKDGAKIYNAAACFGRDGQLIANHRKLALPHGHEAGIFTLGNNLTLFQLGNFTCTILICYEAEFPESVRASCKAGADVIIVPTALVDSWASVAL